MAVVLPLTIKCSEGEVVITSKAEAENYLKKHKKVHNYPTPYNCTDENDTTLLEWFWKRDNFGAQNQINGYLASKIGNFLVDGGNMLSFTIHHIKHKSLSFTMKYNNDDYLKYNVYWSTNESNITVKGEGLGWVANEVLKKFDNFDSYNNNLAEYCQAIFAKYHTNGEDEALGLNMFAYKDDYPNITFNLQ